LDFRNFSEIRSFRWVREVTGNHADFSAALPANASALSLPGVPDAGVYANGGVVGNGWRRGLDRRINLGLAMKKNYHMQVK